MSSRDSKGKGKRTLATFTAGSKVKPAPKAKKPRPAALPDLNIPHTYTRQSSTTVGPAHPLAPKVGKSFHDAIGALRDGGDQIVKTQFNLKVKRGTAKSVSVPIEGEFSVIGQGTGLVQGSLHTPNLTAYWGSSEDHSVLPDNLSLQRARLEGRAIKQLTETGYQADAKKSQLDELTLNKDGSFPKKTTLGGIALGAHLEDITAYRAVSLEDVGSAIRAKTMATKWQILASGKEDAGQGFRNDLLTAVPQLGNDGIEAAGLKKTGIAAVKAHWEAGGTVFSKRKQTKNIEAYHQEAHQAASDLFVKKLKDVRASGDFAQAGKWWTKKSAKLQAIFTDLESPHEATRNDAAERYRAIGTKYVQRKFDRHGIKRS